MACVAWAVGGAEWRRWRAMFVSVGAGSIGEIQVKMQGGEEREKMGVEKGKLKGQVGWL